MTKRLLLIIASAVLLIAGIYAIFTVVVRQG